MWEAERPGWRRGGTEVEFFQVSRVTRSVPVLPRAVSILKDLFGHNKRPLAYSRMTCGCECAPGAIVGPTSSSRVFLRCWPNVQDLGLHQKTWETTAELGRVVWIKG